MPDFAGKLLFV